MWMVGHLHIHPYPKPDNGCDTVLFISDISGGVYNDDVNVCVWCTIQIFILILRLSYLVTLSV
jgi:hypothetical protein